ncbi:MAG: hypothetical protein WCE44_13840 [Candidatus Velthaea sp.]|jgi:DUF4097 and DUF4098 domain-containing protein YvlB
MKLVVIAASALAFACCPFAARAADETGTLNVVLAPGAALVVKDINGDVEVRSGGSFSVTYRKHGSTDLAAVRVLGEQSGGETRVCVRYPGDDAIGCGGGDFSSHSHSDVTVDLKIIVPSGTRVDAATVNGALVLRTDGRVRATTVNGKITADAADAESLRTVNGSVDATLHDPRATGTLRVEAVNGSLILHLPTSDARVRASVLNGGIEAFGLPVDRPQYGPGAKVNGQSGSGGRILELKTLNGSIRVERG